MIATVRAGTTDSNSRERIPSTCRTPLQARYRLLITLKTVRPREAPEISDLPLVGMGDVADLYEHDRLEALYLSRP